MGKITKNKNEHKLDKDKLDINILEIHNPYLLIIIANKSNIVTKSKTEQTWLLIVVAVPSDKNIGEEDMKRYPITKI